MKNLVYHKKFEKSYNERIFPNKNLVKRVHSRLELFWVNRTHPILKNHQLSGKKKNLRSFSITGDVRILYYEDEENIYLVDIGTHNQVYE